MVLTFDLCGWGCGDVGLVSRDNASSSASGGCLPSVANGVNAGCAV